MGDEKLIIISVALSHLSSHMSTAGRGRTTSPAAAAAAGDDDVTDDVTGDVGGATT